MKSDKYYNVPSNGKSVISLHHKQYLNPLQENDENDAFLNNLWFCLGVRDLTPSVGCPCFILASITLTLWSDIRDSVKLYSVCILYSVTELHICCYSVALWRNCNCAAWNRTKYMSVYAETNALRTLARAPAYAILLRTRNFLASRNCHTNILKKQLSRWPKL
jgi:hypothetical protein